MREDMEYVERVLRDWKREETGAYYKENKENIQEQQREYRERNKEKIRKQQREYYQRNRERILAQKKEYYKRKKEERENVRIEKEKGDPQGSGKA